MPTPTLDLKHPIDHKNFFDAKVPVRMQEVSNAHRINVDPLPCCMSGMTFRPGAMS